MSWFEHVAHEAPPQFTQSETVSSVGVKMW